MRKIFISFLILFSTLSYSWEEPTIRSPIESFNASTFVGIVQIQKVDTLKTPTIFTAAPIHTFKGKLPPSFTFVDTGSVPTSGPTRAGANYLVLLQNSIHGLQTAHVAISYVELEKWGAVYLKDKGNIHSSLKVTDKNYIVIGSSFYVVTACINQSLFCDSESELLRFAFNKSINVNAPAAPDERTARPL